MQDETVNVQREPQRVPWSGREIILGFYLVWIFWPFVVQALVQGLRIELLYYADDAENLDKRMSLWLTAFALPFQMLTIPLLFSAYSHTSLAELGLTTRHFGRNVVAGIVGLLVVTPPVLGLNLLLRLLYAHLGGQQVEHHDLEDLARMKLYRSEWVLLFFDATIAAPLREELTFRGVLQPWLAKRRWGNLVVMLAAFFLATLMRREHFQKAWPEGIAPLLEAAAPGLFVIALVPVFWLVVRFSQTSVPPAIFATSLLFACIHTSVWPTPVPIFFLGLGLGMLAQRSRSLVGPIVLHGLFNGIGCLQLLLQ